MLEVIGKGSASESHPVPLLFVQGGYHAAWCWDENFLDYFADKGFRAVAVSLRGHGLSDLSKPAPSQDCRHLRRHDARRRPALRRAVPLADGAWRCVPPNGCLGDCAR
jgi:pimeloyl-ACP methyl ester carboxylesterase